jgi:hypothetical protein
LDITGLAMKSQVLAGPVVVEDVEQTKSWIERATRFLRTLPAKEK